MARLLYSFGTPQAWEIQLRPGANVLGRGAANDFTIDHASISTTHCQIDVADHAVIVRDLGSTNGTFIDRELVSEAVLRSGQTLKLGDIELVFDADTPDELTEMPPPPQPVAMAAAAGVAVQETLAPPAPRASSGPLRCNNHPKSVARMECKQCGRTFCELCVTTRRADGAIRKFCRDCGGECAWISAVLLQPQREERSFYQLLPGAFLYPFQGDGWILMLVGTLFYLFVEFAAMATRFAFFGKGAVGVVIIFAYGYLFAYQMKIITSTIDGKEEMPDWPDFNGVGDVIGPFLQVLVLGLACFLPGVLAIVMFRDQEWGIGVAVTIFCLGGMYLPMSFLAIALFDTLEVLNPLFIIPSILRVLKEYLVACGVLTVSVLLNVLIRFLLEAFVPSTHLAVVLLSGLVSGLTGFYLLIVEMRILGILYRTQQDTLGWFRKG